MNAAMEIPPRRGRRRTRTWPARRATAQEIYELRELAAEPMHWRPTRREQCGYGGCCPYVGCEYHLYLDVTQTGSILLNFPDIEVWEMEICCALDVAEQGDTTLEDIGRFLNITKERVRQIELRALQRLGRELTIWRMNR